MLVENFVAHKPSKEFKDFCNSLRCPLCDSQLDGNIHDKKAQLYCCVNNDEYRCHWYPNDTEPVLEALEFYYPQYEYTIATARITPGMYHTEIARFNSDVAPIYKSSTRVRLFSYNGPRLLIFRQRMEEEQFLKKLKTIQVFS